MPQQQAPRTQQGIGQDATAIISADGTGTVAGTAASHDGPPAVAPNAAAGTSTATAADATTAVAPGPGTATGTGTGHDASAGTRNANAEVATGTGTGHNATVSTSGETTAKGGGWHDLAAIQQERAEAVIAERLAEPFECPNDGTLLEHDANGDLVCPWDGWRPEFSPRSTFTPSSASRWRSDLPPEDPNWG